MTRERVIDLLAMSRFANLPTVWSNGLLGILVGWIYFGRARGPVCPGCLVLIGLSLSCLYLGGCFFNDWHDAEFDQKTRPERPIPSGRWSRTTVLTLAISLMTAGVLTSLLVTAASGLFAIGIVLCILAYTRWHKVHPASFFFMAGARTLIYPLAAMSFVPWARFPEIFHSQLPVFIVLTLALGGYILGISLTARAESSRNSAEEAQRIFPILCLSAPVFFISAPLIFSKSAPALIPLAIFLLVLSFAVRKLRSGQNIGLFVSRALAAIPLVDFLMVFVIAPHPVFIVICPVLALAALGLQKIAPAT